MGAGRRAHHAAVQAQRDQARAAAEFEQMLAAQRDAMLKAQQALKPPTRIKSTVGSQNVGVRTARSPRQSTRNMAQGAAALRIPLNIGGSGGGLNIG